MKLHTKIPKPYRMDMDMHVEAEHFFSNPTKMADLKDMGIEPIPVDAFGAFVPSDKSDSNLKKTEESIQERFGLKAGGEEE